MVAKRFGFGGSRRRNSLADRRQVIELVEGLRELYPSDRFDLRIVTGMCPKGADIFAWEAARSLGIPTIEHPIDFEGLPSWTPGSRREFTQRAYARNERVAQDSLDGFFAQVHGDRTGGTEDAIERCIRLGRQVWLIDDGGDLIAWPVQMKIWSSWVL